MIMMSIFNTFVRRNEILRSHAARIPGMFYLCGEHQLPESRIGPFILLSSQRGTRFNFERSRQVGTPPCWKTDIICWKQDIKSKSTQVQASYAHIEKKKGEKEEYKFYPRLR